jgi:HK97 family phage prohead protease
MKEILTKLENEFKKRNFSEDDITDVLSENLEIRNRRIIAGYASVSIYDREGHRITIPALKESVKRFMEEEHYRPITVFHSDITIGRILPKWTNPKTGREITTHVDDTGWFIVAEIRDDIEVASKVWKEIEKGNLKSFSIAGTSKNKSQAMGNQIDINELDIYEVTVCEIPVNQMSKFDVLFNPNEVTI